MSGMVEHQRGSSRREFFAKKVKSMLPPEFYRDLEVIERMVNTMSRRDVLARYAELGTKTVTFELVKPFTFLMRSEDIYEAVMRGYIAPSMFVKYRQCARGLAIELLSVKEHGGVLVTIDNIRSLLRGVLVHKLYYERYAVGETEVMVVSERDAIVGYVDELRRWGEGAVVIELKSSHRPDVVGSSLQVMAYMLALSGQLELPLERVEGYVVSPGATYRVEHDPEVFEEYSKRLRKVVEIAISGAVDHLPPRLSSDLSSRCDSCAYRGRCLNLPDNYRTYSRFFNAMGFKRLHQDEGPNLFRYAT